MRKAILTAITITALGIVAKAQNLPWYPPIEDSYVIPPGSEVEYIVEVLTNKAIESGQKSGKEVVDYPMLTVLRMYNALAPLVMADILTVLDQIPEPRYSELVLYYERQVWLEMLRSAQAHFNPGKGAVIPPECYNQKENEAKEPPPDWPDKSAEQVQKDNEAKELFAKIIGWTVLGLQLGDNQVAEPATWRPTGHGTWDGG